MLPPVWRAFLPFSHLRINRLKEECHLKQKLNKYKTKIGEILIGVFIVNVFALGIMDSLMFALICQLVYLFLCDYILRKNLVKSKRRITWNILLWTLKSTAILLSCVQEYMISLLLTIMGVVSNRIMFFDDQDRTVQTIDELKEAYFIPIIINLKERAIYVLSD
jgi:hypothetical protein